MNPAGFKWGQTASTVTVSFPVPPGVTKTQVDVSITSSTLVAGIKAQPPVLSVRAPFRPSPLPRLASAPPADADRRRRARCLIMC